MTIQQCKYVLEIAKLGSFNEASKQLFVAQSGLSSSVKQLEKELGIKIFERSKNGVCLSRDGVEFVRYAQQIVTQSEFVQNRYGGVRDYKKLHVATQHYDFVADAFCKFLKQNNDQKYDFSIKEMQTHQVISEVERAFCDVGVLAIKDSDFDIMTRYLNSKGVVFKEFLQALPHVYVRKTHALGKRHTVSFDELADYPYLSYEQGAHNSSYFTEELVGEYSGDKHITISDRATLMNVLLTTDSYTVGTGVMPSALNNGKIVGLKIESQSFYRIGYILRKGASESELTTEFIKELEEIANKQKIAIENRHNHNI